MAAEPELSIRDSSPMYLRLSLERTPCATRCELTALCYKRPRRRMRGNTACYGLVEGWLKAIRQASSSHLKNSELSKWWCTFARKKTERESLRDRPRTRWPMQ